MPETRRKYDDGGAGGSDVLRSAGGVALAQAPLVLPPAVVPGRLVDPRRPGDCVAPVVGHRPGRPVGHCAGQPPGPGCQRRGHRAGRRLACSLGPGGGRCRRRRPGASAARPACGCSAGPGRGATRRGPWETRRTTGTRRDVDDGVGQQGIVVVAVADRARPPRVEAGGRHLHHTATHRGLFGEASTGRTTMSVRNVDVTGYPPRYGSGTDRSRALPRSSPRGS